jgi:uncharacterized protein YoxC
MDQQLSIALQVVLYVAAVAIIVLAAVLIVLLLQLRSRVERVARVVERLEAELSPLARETRVVVEGLGDLSRRVQGQWTEVERIIDTARSWSQRANHLVDEVGSVVEPPIFTASRNFRILRRGLETFVKVLFNGKRDDQQEEREP